MGKNAKSKARMAYAIDEESKTFLEAWAEEEGRAVANLVERLLLDAIAKKKQDSTLRVASIGKIGSDRKSQA